jgi:hypothetical protein
MAATILRARRPPWSAPKHADHSRAGPKNATGRYFMGLPGLPRSWTERRSPGAWTAAPLHRCKAAPASPGHQAPSPGSPSCRPTGWRRQAMNEPP